MRQDNHFKKKDNFSQVKSPSNKKLLKFSKDWLFSPALWSLMRNIKNGHLKSNTSPEMINFKNKHKGKRFFILASGPSINTQDLKKLKDELCISVSLFGLHKDFHIIQPQYHFEVPWHPPFTISDINKFLLIKKNMNVSWKHTCFIGDSGYEPSFKTAFDLNPALALKDYFYIDYRNAEELSEKNMNNPSSWDVFAKPFAMRTVIYGAIQMAYYMGASEIYLLGCDHDYINDLSKKTDLHFYEEKDGISDVKHLNAFTTEDWFKEYYLRWKQYRLMNTFLQKNGCCIYNATNGGVLDVFPRINFEDL